MDVKHLNPALQSVVNVLSTMAGITPTIGKPTIKEDNNAPGVVTGLIDMAGKQTQGSLAISFSEPVALEIAEKMLGLNVSQIDAEIEDMVGEMANMMAGGAKAIYEEQGLDFDLTRPEVISGENHEVNHRVDGTTILLPFTTETGQFYIEACFSS